MQPHFFRSPVASVASIVLVAGLIAATARAQSSVDARPDVHFVPTPQKVVDRMLQLARPKAGEFLIDLGSGDGRIPITAAKRYGIQALGIDIDPVRIAEANRNAKKAGVAGKVAFRQENLFETDISKADIITLYLLERLNMKLRPRLFSELRPGARVVSHDFSMGDWKPDRYETVQNSTIYFWTIPGKVEGRWQMQSGNETIVLEFKQKHQEVSGTAEVKGRKVAITNARLDGVNLTFHLAGQTYRGTVNGNVITAARGNAREWRAVRS
jgi:predicted O-methyltransferase YrrM